MCEISADILLVSTLLKLFSVSGILKKSTFLKNKKDWNIKRQTKTEIKEK